MEGGGGGGVKGRIPVRNIPGDEWESRSTQGKKTLVGCSENPMKYDINLDEGVTAIKAQENNQNKMKKQKESYTHTIAVLW